MLLSRFRSTPKKTEADKKDQKIKENSIPELEELLSKRDYSGAISLLEFRKREDNTDEPVDLWLAYCAFHSGQYSTAVEIYEKLLERGNCSEQTQVFLACAYFYLNKIDKAKDVAEKAPKTPLQNRLLLQIYDRLNDEDRVKACHAQLTETSEDILSLAAVQFRRSHYQEAIECYKKILSENKDFMAIHVYLALCYYKLDYYDVALDTVDLYLSQYPDSPFALNLRACAKYRLYNGASASQELLRIPENSVGDCLNAKNLIDHNKVVFCNGEGALLTLPLLINIIPEARLNLMRFYLQRDDLESAFKLIEDEEPSSAQEYFLRAVIFYKLGIEKKSAEYEKKAAELFLTVGESAVECDTVAGRQAMASAHFLSGQMEEVLVYLDSIKEFFEEDDTFNYNFGQALLINGRSAEAEEVLLRITDQNIKKRLTYILNLVRAYCLNKKGNLAWLLCSNWNGYEGLPTLLRVIANDCYQVEDYYHSALAFGALEQVEPNLSFWEPKKGAIAGMVKNVIRGIAPRSHLKEAVTMLEDSTNPEAESLLNVLIHFCEVNKIDLSQ